MEPEHAQVCDELELRGISVELFTLKRLHRDQLNLSPQTLVVGDHDVMRSVFKRMSLVVQSNCYPPSLHAFLHRKVWESTVQQVLFASQNGQIGPVFVKPRSRTKSFTGFVVQSGSELLQLSGVSRNTEVFCAEVVEWQSEYRTFISGSKLVGTRHYEGNPGLIPDQSTIDQAIQIFEESGAATAGYSLDFGVLSNGKTALVEWNDGFALGSYGLEPSTYTDLLMGRWNDLFPA